MCSNRLTGYIRIALTAVYICILLTGMGSAQELSRPPSPDTILLEEATLAKDTTVSELAPATEPISQEQEESITPSDVDSSVAKTANASNSITQSAEYQRLHALIEEITDQPELWYTQRRAAESGLATSDNGYHQSGALYGLSIATLLFNDRKFLDTAIALSIDYISKGEDLDSDGYNDWYWGHDNDFHRINQDHYEWKAAMGIAYVATTLVQLETQTQDDVNNLAIIKNYLQRHVWEKWSIPNNPAGRSNIQTSGSEYISRLSVTALALDQMTNDPQYREFLTKRSSLLIDMLELNYNKSTDSVFLSNRIDGTTGSATSSALDVAHGNDIVNWLNYAYRIGENLGGRLEEKHLIQLKNTVTNVIYTTDEFSTYTDGTGAKNSHLSNNHAGWTFLAAFDENLRERWIRRALTHETTTTSKTGGVGYENRLMYFTNLVAAMSWSFENTR